MVPVCSATSDNVLFEEVKDKMKKAEDNYDKENNTIKYLKQAAKKNNIAVINYLVTNYGESIDSYDACGILSESQSSSFATIQALSVNAEIKKQESQDQIILKNAVERNNETRVKFLLQLFTKTNKNGSIGYPPEEIKEIIEGNSVSKGVKRALLQYPPIMEDEQQNGEIIIRAIENKQVSLFNLLLQEVTYSERAVASLLASIKKNYWTDSKIYKTMAEALFTNPKNKKMALKNEQQNGGIIIEVMENNQTLFFNFFLKKITYSKDAIASLLASIKKEYWRESNIKKTMAKALFTSPKNAKMALKSEQQNGGVIIEVMKREQVNLFNFLLQNIAYSKGAMDSFLESIIAPITDLEMKMMKTLFNHKSNGKLAIQREQEKYVLLTKLTKWHKPSLFKIFFNPKFFTLLLNNVAYQKEAIENTLWSIVKEGLNKKNIRKVETFNMITTLFEHQAIASRLIPIEKEKHTILKKIINVSGPEIASAKSTLLNLLLKKVGYDKKTLQHIPSNILSKELTSSNIKIIETLLSNGKNKQDIIKSETKKPTILLKAADTNDTKLFKLLLDNVNYKPKTIQCILQKILNKELTSSNIQMIEALLTNGKNKQDIIKSEQKKPTILLKVANMNAPTLFRLLLDNVPYKKDIIETTIQNILQKKFTPSSIQMLITLFSSKKKAEAMQIEQKNYAILPKLAASKITNKNALQLFDFLFQTMTYKKKTIETVIQNILQKKLTPPSMQMLITLFSRKQKAEAIQIEKKNYAILPQLAASDIVTNQNASQLFDFLFQTIAYPKDTIKDLFTNPKTKKQVIAKERKDARILTKIENDKEADLFKLLFKEVAYQEETIKNLLTKSAYARKMEQQNPIILNRAMDDKHYSFVKYLLQQSGISYDDKTIKTFQEKYLRQTSPKTWNIRLIKSLINRPSFIAKEKKDGALLINALKKSPPLMRALLNASSDKTENIGIPYTEQAIHKAMKLFRDQDIIASGIPLENIKILFTNPSIKPHFTKIENENGYLLHYSALQEDTSLENMLEDTIEKKELTYKENITKELLEDDSLSPANKRKLKYLLSAEVKQSKKNYVFLTLPIFSVIAVGTYLKVKKISKKKKKSNLPALTETPSETQPKDEIH